MTCTRIHQLTTDIDVYGMIEASVGTIQEQASGGVEFWSMLVSQCVLALVLLIHSGPLPLGNAIACVKGTCCSLPNAPRVKPDRYAHIVMFVLQMMYWICVELMFAQFSRLQLSPQALSRASTLRETYLQKLDCIYNERQTLNLEAVKALLPEEVGMYSAIGSPCLHMQKCVASQPPLEPRTAHIGVGILGAAHWGSAHSVTVVASQPCLKNALLVRPLRKELWTCLCRRPIACQSSMGWLLIIFQAPKECACAGVRPAALTK
jgi:hypothetical protein